MPLIGPAASGKSTVAKLIADRLGYTFINTGAMYRAVTWYMLEQGIDPADTDAVLAALPPFPSPSARTEAAPSSSATAPP